MLRLPRSLKTPATVAVLDCGTNSTLLLVARLEPNGKIVALRQSISSSRLGEGLADGGKLKPQAVARTLRALKKLKREAARYKPDCFFALGTDIFRRARDGRLTGQRFEKLLGFPFWILSASEEARLEFLGATAGLKTNSKIVVIDVGGGSSEVIWGQREKLADKVSFEIGAVRLKEKFAGMSNYSEGALRKLRLQAVQKISKLKLRKDYPLAVLTGGTATTLAALSLGLKRYKGEKVHGFQTTPQKLKEGVEKLARFSLSQRKKALSFDPARVDIVVPGGIILLEILKRLGVKKAAVSDHGLRWGALHSYFS
jgi:exopolyphosphatase/guanosine-5'-triphosphate,3'-diphosphate pyrophosphatase